MGFSELANIQNDITGNTILHDLKDTDVIQEFFRQNGNANITNKSGNTALHTSMDCVWNVTKLLLDNKADINIRNNENITPMLKAAIVSRNRFAEIVDYLKIDITTGPGQAMVNEILENPQVHQVNKDWIRKEQERQVEEKKKPASNIAESDKTDESGEPAQTEY